MSVFSTRTLRENFFLFQTQLNTVNTSLLLSALTFPTLALVQELPSLVVFAFHFTFSYLFSWSVSFLVEHIYKPRFFNEKTMNVADYIDATLADKKEYPILEEKIFDYRAAAERQIWAGLLSIVLYFIVLTILFTQTSVLIVEKAAFAQSEIKVVVLSVILFTISSWYTTIVQLSVENDIAEAHDTVRFYSSIPHIIINILLYICYYASLYFIIH